MISIAFEQAGSTSTKPVTITRAIIRFIRSVLLNRAIVAVPGVALGG